MSYILESFSSGKYIIKDGKGNVVTDEPLLKKEAIEAMIQLAKPAEVVIPKKVKKEKKNDKREERERSLDD